MHRQPHDIWRVDYQLGPDEDAEREAAAGADPRPHRAAPGLAGHQRPVDAGVVEHLPGPRPVPHRLRARAGALRRGCGAPGPDLRRAWAELRDRGRRDTGLAAGGGRARHRRRRTAARLLARAARGLAAEHRRRGQEHPDHDARLPRLHHVARRRPRPGSRPPGVPAAGEPAAVQRDARPHLPAHRGPPRAAPGIAPGDPVADRSLTAWTPDGTVETSLDRLRGQGFGVLAIGVAPAALRPAVERLQARFPHESVRALVVGPQDLAGVRRRRGRGGRPGRRAGRGPGRPARRGLRHPARRTPAQPAPRRHRAGRASPSTCSGAPPPPAAHRSRPRPPAATPRSSSPGGR